jgi:hypothetical protein
MKIDGRPLVSVLRAYEFQHRHFEALFGQAPFDEVQFDFGQRGFEYVLVVTNILLMAAQTRISVVHNRRLPKIFFVT